MLNKETKTFKMVALAELGNYDLVVFDVNGALAQKNSNNLLPVAERFFAWARAEYDAGNHRVSDISLIASESVVGLRYAMIENDWGTPDSLPSLADVHQRLVKIQSQIPFYTCMSVSYAYRNSRNGTWGETPVKFAGSREWRRDWVLPSPGMLTASMNGFNVAAKRTLVISDKIEALHATQAVGASFCWIADFRDTIDAELAVQVKI